MIGVLFFLILFLLVVACICSSVEAEKNRGYKARKEWEDRCNEEE